LFQSSSAELQLKQAHLVDQYAPDMALKDKYLFSCAPIALNVPFEKDYYLLCLRSVALSQARRLPTAPNWLTANDAKHLEEAELLSHNLSLYVWLSFKFPQIFIDAAQVTSLRQAISRYIAQALLCQVGYGDTSRELDSLMQKRP
jgi:ATP-dependent RNA helicase SUPV3L1/SUV3